MCRNSGFLITGMMVSTAGSVALCCRKGGSQNPDRWLRKSRNTHIRSSEKVFWRKVLEIYATSIDYNPSAEESIIFFKQVQNKMHWAAHKHTAAEVVFYRADAEKENMGLTSWEGKQIKKSDSEIAKNYLNDEEIDALNKIVTAYLDIAEVQALNHEPVYVICPAANLPHQQF